MNHPIRLFLAVLLTALFTLPLWSRPDEGMWTFDNPPTAQLQSQYDFTPTPEWLEKVRLSSVRFNDGGSGSFVSAHGLVMTNHHVGVGQIQKLSTPENDLVQTGFFAATAAEELKCPDLELNVLMKMENVTEQVRAAVTDDMNAEAALKARQAAIAAMENAAQEESGLRADMVKLYNGGEYWLYYYKKYTDVRLVFAPEKSTAYFGGELDNFTYPRYCLDVAFFRVYEDDRPISSPNHFAWNTGGAAEGDLVFVSGHPGTTNRLYTMAQLEYNRDHYYPILIDYINRQLAVLQDYSSRGDAQRMQAQTRIFGLGNSQKAYDGMYAGLLNERIMALRQENEADFRAKVNADPELKAAYGDAWAAVEALMAEHAEAMAKSFFKSAPRSSLFGKALTLVRVVKEAEKPDGERLDGYHENELPRKIFALKSPAPVYPELEAVTFTDYLDMAVAYLGGDDPIVKAMLEGKAPADLAAATVLKSKMHDAGFRTELLDGGLKAVQKSKDPLIKLALKMDDHFRAVETWKENEIEAVLSEAAEKIAKARFAVYGKSTYPDANFTLRLSYGAVKGYAMNGTVAPPKTTLYGLYDRTLSFNRSGDFELPERYWSKKADLDLTTPVNFVSTNDVVGGNSGSPVINRDAEVVGLVFDGNIESLVGRFVYDETTNRTVSVHSGYIIEALRKLYAAGGLADELENGGLRAVK